MELDIAGLLSVLQAGGNVAMIALFFLMWNFDRRLIKIETKIEALMKIEES